MAEAGRELTLDDLPRPPLFKLVDPEGRDVFQETPVGGERALVAAAAPAPRPRPGAPRRGRPGRARRLRGDAGRRRTRAGGGALLRQGARRGVLRRGGRARDG